MTVFVSDTFTDTDSTTLQSHTGETGATWTEHPNELGTDAKIISNAAKKDSASGVTYYASGTPASNEYDVEGVSGASTSGSVGTGLLGRIPTGSYTGYIAWGASATTLYKAASAASWTSIGSYASAWSNGTAVKLEIRTATKKVWLDGVSRITSTDDTYTTTGKAGLRFYGNGGILDNFVATDTSSGGTTVSLTTASYSWTKNTQQLFLNTNFSSRLLNFLAKDTQNTQTIKPTTSTFQFVTSTIQNKLNIFLDAATQSFTAAAITLGISIGLGSTFLYFIGQGIEVTGAVAGVVARLLALMGVGS